MINAKSAGNSDYTPVDAGTYVARCFSMILLGTNKEMIMGKVKTLTKVRLTWELPLETKEFKPGEGAKPFIVSKEFTLSLSKKANLRAFLEGWRSRGFTELEAKDFDITALLGVPCMLSVIHKISKSSGNTYADISSCSKLPKGTTCPPQVNPNFELNFEEGWSDEKFESLPDFIKDKIVSSKEYKDMMNPHEVDASEVDLENDEDDPNDGSDLPF